MTIRDINGTRVALVLTKNLLLLSRRSSSASGTSTSETSSSTSTFGEFLKEKKQIFLCAVAINTKQKDCVGGTF